MVINSVLNVKIQRLILHILAETSNCVEKVRDCEDYAKKEIEKLKKSIDENEKFFRKELWQLREQTGELSSFFTNPDKNYKFQTKIQKKSQGH